MKRCFCPFHHSNTIYRIKNGCCSFVWICKKVIAGIIAGEKVCEFKSCKMLKWYTWKIHDFYISFPICFPLELNMIIHTRYIHIFHVKLVLTNLCFPCGLDAISYFTIQEPHQLTSNLEYIPTCWYPAWSLPQNLWSHHEDFGLRLVVSSGCNGAVTCCKLDKLGWN